MTHFGRMPMAEEHQLRPEQRLLYEKQRLEAAEKIDPEDDLYASICNLAFYNTRELAFSASMPLPRILNFLDRYNIPYKQPELRSGPNPAFWAMIYAGIMCSEAGGSGSVERAKIWLACTDQVSFDPRSQTYRVGSKRYLIHPLLTRKKPCKKPLSLLFSSTRKPAI